MIQFTSLRNALVRAVGKMLPNRTKKLILLSSLHAKINSVSRPDRAIARKLNQTMALSTSYDALLFPMQLGTRFWKSSISVECGGINQIKIEDLGDIALTRLTKAQMRIVSDQILKIVPDWLMYGSKRQMKQDLTKMLASYQEHQLA